MISRDNIISSVRHSLHRDD